MPTDGQHLIQFKMLRPCGDKDAQGLSTVPGLAHDLTSLLCTVHSAQRFYSSIITSSNVLRLDGAPSSWPKSPQGDAVVHRD